MFPDSDFGNLNPPPPPAVPASVLRPRRLRSGSVKQLLIIVISCTLVLAAFYAMSQMGPSRYEGAVRRNAIPKEQAEKLRSIAEAAENKWEAVRKKRVQTKTKFTDDDIALIGEATAAALQYETQVEEAPSRYPALRKELHDRMGESMRDQSTALEKLANAAANEKRYAEAEKIYSNAREIEEHINSDYPESAYKSLQRVTYLDSRARLMRARPIWEQSVASEKAGEAAFARGDIPAAISGVAAAHADNYKLEREYRGLTPADGLRTRTLERRLDTLRSITERDRILEKVAIAEKMAADRKFSTIQSLRKETESALRDLVEKHPESEYAAPKYVAELVRRVQNAASTADAEAVERDIAGFSEAVRKADPQAATLAENLQRAVLRVRELYPEADRVGPAMAERVAFLFEHRTEIAVVGAAIGDSLREVPGHSGLMALRNETSQRLYSLVTGDNPSAIKDPKRPVESVTREEARTFCRRLGWLIGRTVRLPDEAEFRAMVGKPTLESLATTARAIDNSDGTAGPTRSAAVDAGGFYDLLGNVAEWIESPAGEAPNKGRVAGGDVESTLSQLAKIPVNTMMANERSRFVGFRFVVEPVAAP